MRLGYSIRDRRARQDTLPVITHRTAGVANSKRPAGDQGGRNQSDELRHESMTQAPQESHRCAAYSLTVLGTSRINSWHRTQDSLIAR